MVEGRRHAPAGGERVRCHRGRLHIEYTFVSNGRVEVRRGSHRAYTYRQLVELIEAAGFTVETDSPWTRDAKMISFIATRR